MLKIISLLFLTFSINCFAQENYKVFGKISLSYILSQTNSLTIDNTKYKVSYKSELYEGENFSYSLETGVKVPLDNSNKYFLLGLSYYNLLNQGESRYKHKPYFLEVFSDYRKEFDNFYFQIGVGYKLLYQEKIHDPNFLTVDNKDYHNTTGNKILDNITARFALGYDFNDNYSINLVHHSQYLVGKPIGNNWEYQYTGINFSYSF